MRCLNDAPQLPNAVVVGNLGLQADWAKAVDGMTCVVHSAAHISSINPAELAAATEYRRANVDGTVKLAQQAAAAGVRRFVFISTAKVLGERTASGSLLSEGAPYAPCDAYATSKMEAELALLAMIGHTDMEIVIVRPPMVYGLNAKGNFNALIKLLHWGIPLPLAGIKNQRSFVSIDNLVDFVWMCTWHPAAANQVFHVCDEKDLTTSELVRAIEKSFKRPVYLFHLPEPMLRLGFQLIGRMDIFQRLHDNFQLDASKAKALMQWSPTASIEDALNPTMVKNKA